MKRCPFCGEGIRDEAIKCRYCGEFLENQCSQTSTDDSPAIMAQTPAPSNKADSYGMNPVLLGSMIGFLVGFGGCMTAFYSGDYGEHVPAEPWLAGSLGVITGILGAVIGLGFRKSR